MSLVKAPPPDRLPPGEEGLNRQTPLLTDAMLTSPCTGVCAIEPETGWCRGCRRTRDEIRQWTQFTPAERRAVLAGLADRAGGGGA